MSNRSKRTKMTAKATTPPTVRRMTGGEVMERITRKQAIDVARRIGIDAEESRRQEAEAESVRHACSDCEDAQDYIRELETYIHALETALAQINADDVVDKVDEEGGEIPWSEVRKELGNADDGEGDDNGN